MVARRTVLTGVLGAAALLPALLWLAPALVARQAPSFHDQGDFFFPLKLYTADRLKSGEIPLWNPLSGLGEPWLANGQSGVFYPPTLLFLLPFPALAAGLFLLLHFAIGVSGAWRFAKDEAVSDPGALLGAAAFGACGLAASLSAYWNHFGAWAYLPWIAACARSGLRSRTSRFALAAAVGLQALAGSPEISAATLCLAALFVWHARRESSSGWLDPPRGKRLLRLVGGTGLGLALAGVTLVPMAELALRSQRRVALPAAERDRGSVGLSALSSGLGLSPGASGTEYLSTLYAGPLMLCAAAAAFLEPQRRRLALLLAAIAAAGVLASMSAPPGPWIRFLPFLDRIRYPAKFLVWTFFALPMLAGVGADAFRFAPGRRRALVMTGIGMGGLALLIFSRQPTAVRLAEAIGLAALVWLPSARTRPAARDSSAGAQGALLQTVAALALAASLFLAARPAFRFAPEAEVRRVPHSIPFLAHVAGRVLTPPPLDLSEWVLRDARFDASTLRRQREALLGYTNLLSGVSTVRTASALPTQAQERIAASIDAADPVRAAGAVAGRVLWSPFLPDNMGLRTVGEFSRAPLNPYRSRLSFVPGYRVEADPARAWAGAARGERDWSREVALDREPDPRPAAGEKRSFVLARIAEDRPERVVADVNAGTAGILVLADLDYPGWKAAVDGRPAPILTADGCLRAVALPAGSHQVVFRYRPVSFYAGAALSVLALGILVLTLNRV